MSIFTNWDQLEEVIVGNCPTEIPDDWSVSNDVRKTFNLILSETKEDLDNLSNYIRDTFKVKVHRPKIINFSQNIKCGDFIIRNPAFPIVPRDQYFAYDKALYQTYTSLQDRYVDSLAYYDIFLSLFEQGYNWLSQPPPNMKNFFLATNSAAKQVYLPSPYFDLVNSVAPYDNWQAVDMAPNDLYKKYSNHLLWHTANFFKCGEDIITNNLGPGTSLGLEWMKRNLSANIVRNEETIMNGWGHIDHGFYMPNDNMVICTSREWVPKCLLKKHIVELKGLYKLFDYNNFYKSTQKFKDNLNLNNDQSVLDWLNYWLMEWKGYAQEVAFESNVLVVNPTNIVYNIEQPEVFKFLETFGIKSHVCKIRHGGFWDAGIHCLTLDIKRKGDKRKIIHE